MLDVAVLNVQLTTMQDPSITQYLLCLLLEIYIRFIEMDSQNIGVIANKRCNN